VYGIALSVAACLRAGTRVDVAWVVEAHGFSSRDRADALAVTPGGGRVGSLLSGSLDEQLADAARQGNRAGRLLDLHVGDVDALAVGLSCGGDARCLLVPAIDLPPPLWELLTAREPVCLISRLDGDTVVETALFTSETIATASEQAAEVFGRGVSDGVITDEAVVTVFWPVPKLVVVGGGAVADALTEAAALLGWQTQTITDAPTATGVVAGLAVLDKVVVTSHDVEIGGPALAAALASDVGYIGALGSRRTQQARADWLAYRGIIDLDRIHGPAGLAIGADTPAEIAVSILAEALAVRSGSAAGDLHWMRRVDV
jgi:xanthine dehydrogenase accessory factor